MPEPSYYTEGTTPRRTDTRIVIVTKQLGELQNRDGADPANNPRRNDTLRMLKEKLLKAWRNL